MVSVETAASRGLRVRGAGCLMLQAADLILAARMSCGLLARGCFINLDERLVGLAAVDDKFEWVEFLVFHHQLDIGQPARSIDPCTVGRSCVRPLQYGGRHLMVPVMH